MQISVQRVGGVGINVYLCGENVYYEKVMCKIKSTDLLPNTLRWVLLISKIKIVP